MTTIFPSLKLMSAERVCRFNISWKRQNIPAECKSILAGFEIYKSNFQLLAIINQYVKDKYTREKNNPNKRITLLHYDKDDIMNRWKLGFLSEPITSQEIPQQDTVIQQLESGQRDINILMITAYQGDPDGFEYYFLKYRDKNGFFKALDIALEMGKIDFIVNRIIEIDVDLSDDEGNTVLMWAIKKELLYLVKLLIKEKADVNASNNNGLTPLLIFCSQFHNKNINYNLYRILSELLEAGAQTDICDNKGITPLMHIALNGPLVFLKALIKKKALVNAQDNAGRTALHYIANRLNNLFEYNDRKGMIIALKQAGINCNITDNEGLTAKMLAIKLKANSFAQEL